MSFRYRVLNYGYERVGVRIYEQNVPRSDVSAVDTGDLASLKGIRFIFVSFADGALRVEDMRAQGGFWGGGRYVVFGIGFG